MFPMIQLTIKSMCGLFIVYLLQTSGNISEVVQDRYRYYKYEVVNQ